MLKEDVDLRARETNLTRGYEYDSLVPKRGRADRDRLPSGAWTATRP
jgi:hypothetical protein